MTNSTFLADTTLLNRHLAVATVVAGVVRALAKSSGFPHTFNRVLWVSSFYGLMLHTICS